VAEARLRDREVWSVIAWIPQGGELAYGRFPCPTLLRIWRDAAAGRMLTAWEEALGGVPPDLTVHMIAPRGTPGPMLVQLADRDGDLLVVGAGTRNVLVRTLTRSVSRYCLARARCAVLTVPPPPLERELAHHPLARRRIIRQITRSHAH